MPAAAVAVRLLPTEIGGNPQAKTYTRARWNMRIVRRSIGAAAALLLLSGTAVAQERPRPRETRADPEAQAAFKKGGLRAPSPR